MPLYPGVSIVFRLQRHHAGETPNVVMLFHVLPDEFSEEVKQANYEFYEKPDG